MERIIADFYCYDCKTNQHGAPYVEIIQIDGLVKNIFCPKCKEWKPVSNTSIMFEEKYIIVNWRTWSIIDNDSQKLDILIEGSNIESIKKICQKFNSDPNYDRHKAYIDYMKESTPLGGINIIEALEFYNI